MSTPRMERAADDGRLFFRPCGEEDLPALLTMQEETFAALSDSSLLRRNTPHMLRQCLRAPNWTIGAWSPCGAESPCGAATLAAFSVLFFPQEESETLALALQGQPWRQGLEVTANNKLCMVRETWRGQRLQLHLGWQIEREAVQRGVQLLCATAAPHNAASCRSLLLQGYRLDRQTEKYGLPRNLYYKRIG